MLRNYCECLAEPFPARAEPESLCRIAGTRISPFNQSMSEAPRQVGSAWTWSHAGSTDRCLFTADGVRLAVLLEDDRVQVVSASDGAPLAACVQHRRIPSHGSGHAWSPSCGHDPSGNLEHGRANRNLLSRIGDNVQWMNRRSLSSTDRNLLRAHPPELASSAAGSRCAYRASSSQPSGSTTRFGLPCRPRGVPSSALG